MSSDTLQKHIPNRVLDLPEGRFMVVSDVHGHRGDFYRILEVWRQHQEKGETDGLIFLGDLIHGRGKWEDASPDFIDDLIALKCNQPGSKVYALLGNHELVHIYHTELWSATYNYTQEFEQAIAHNRDRYVSFLENMPFYIRTKGGCLLTHSGGSSYLSGVPAGRILPDNPVRLNFHQLDEWDHREVLGRLALKSQVHLPQEELQRKLIPQIGENFRYFPEGNLLWEMFMNKNERVYLERYPAILERSLAFLSYGHSRGLKVAITGHIRVPEGHEVVNTQQLRLCTAYGAESDFAKTYVIVDAARTYGSAWELSTETRRLFS